MLNTAIRNKAATDNTAPKPIDSNISNRQQDVAINTHLSITFDEPIKAGNGFFVISNGLNDTRYFRATDSKAVTIKDNTITLDPRRDLLAGSQYFVQMSAGAVTDSAGNTVAEVMDTQAFSFTTAVDNTPPIPLRTTPNYHAEQVDIAANIVVVFNEPIKMGTGNITISNGQGDTRTIAVKNVYDSQSKVHDSYLTINPTQNLLSNSQYYVLVDNGAITDLAGNAFTGTQDPTAFTFKTTSDTTAPLLLTNATPSNPSIGSLTLSFNEPVKAGSGVIIIADSQGNKQSMAIHDTAQVSIASAYNIASASNENTVTLAPTAGLIAGAQYFVQMGSGVLTDQLGNAFAGTQEALSYTVLMPTPPIPIHSTPADDKTQVALASDISLRFNEKVNLSTGHFIISNGLGDTRIIAGNDNSQVSYSLTGGKYGTPTGAKQDYTMVIINPKEDLLVGSQYYVQMEAGAVRDIEGAPVAEVMDTTALNFTTIAKDTTAPIGLSSSPSHNAQQVPIDSNITGQFNESIKTGVGHFILSNGLGDTRTIAANDYNQVSYYKDSITINPTNDLLGNNTYTLTVDNSAIIDLQGNAFAGGTLHFTTAPTPIIPVDTTAPKLFPYDTVAMRQISDNIVLSFNEPIKIGTGQLVLNNGLGDIRTIAMDDQSQISIINERQLMINPTLSLLANSHYTLQITAGAVNDLAGNAFAGIQDTTTATLYTSHGKSLAGITDNKTINFDTAVTWNGGFNLAQHSFGGNDVVISADGMSASVELNELSTVTTGDLLTLTGLSDVYGNSGDVVFTL